MKTEASLLSILQPGFLLIVACWLGRLLFAAGGLPRFFVYVTSLSVAAPLAIILTTVLLHARGQSSYRRVFLSAFLLVGCAQLLIITAIVFALQTGIDNVYTAPAFSIPNDPQHVAHLWGHLVAIPFGTVVGGGIGSLVLWLLRWVERSTVK